MTNTDVRMLDRLPAKDAALEGRAGAVGGALITAHHTCGAGGVVRSRETEGGPASHGG